MKSTKPNYVVILTDSLRLTTNKMTHNNPDAIGMRLGKFSIHGVMYVIKSAHTSSLCGEHPLRFVVDYNRHAPIHPEVWDYTGHYNRSMEKAHGEIKLPLCL